MDLTTSILFIALAFGVAAALIGWLVARAVSKVPEENREYKDPPPIAFRLVWWPIQWISHYLDPFIVGKRRAALLSKLRKGGLDYAISPTQFIAARMMSALIMAALFWWVTGSFESAMLEQGDSTGFTLQTYVHVALVAALLGWLYPAIWLKDRLARRHSELLKSLPFFLDIITLCVEAGLNFQGAMNQAVLKGPKGVLRDEFQRVLRDMRAGKSRAESLRDMSGRLNVASVTNFVTAVVQAERVGMNLGPVLRAQADQRRSERFLRAEKLALEAPVKMLFPLIAFIFPCTFIVIFFPIVMQFMHSGL